MDNWVLVDKDYKLVDKGLKLTSRGEDFVLTGGRPPQHEASSGRVYVKPWGCTEPLSEREFFPHVFDLTWEKL